VYATDIAGTEGKEKNFVPLCLISVVHPSENRYRAKQKEMAVKRKRVKKASPPNTKGRILILQAVFVLIIAGMAVRLYQLQIIQHHFYAEKVLPRGKSAPSLAAGPRRGSIYDQKGRELAVSIRLNSVYGIPGQLRQEDNTKIYRMCSILQVPASCLENKLDSRQHFIWIKRKIAPKVATRLEELNVEGIGFREENQRYYPARELSSQVVGFTGMDNHGLEGAELFFDKLLSNYDTHQLTSGLAENQIPGTEYGPSTLPLSPGGRRQGEGVNLDQRTEPGNRKACNILLTIDKVIQYQTEKELDESCTASRAKAGTAIVMDVQSNEILAMANWPSFNPNSFSKYPVDYRRNRCITDAFEPGSVFKIFLASAALEAGKIEPNNLIYCENGVFQIGSRRIRDTHRHEWLTLGDIIRVSSNIGAAKIGLALGREKLYQTIKEFGFGERTGIQLPGEAEGFIPPIKRWTDLTTANISFGQGILTTPLQLITALCCLANKGLWREPRILKGVMNEDGEVIEAGDVTQASDPGQPRRVVSAATCKTLTGMMEMVVKSGTGTAASIPGYQVAGKTGTAQKVDPVSRCYSQDLFCSSFIGFFPAGSPRIAILVTIDEPKEEHLAGVVAAPAFRKIAKSIIRYLNIPPVQGGETPTDSLLRLAGTESVEGKSTGDGARSAEAEAVHGPGAMVHGSEKGAKCGVRGAEQNAQRVTHNTSTATISSQEAMSYKPGTGTQKKAEQNALRTTHSAPFTKGRGRQK